MWSKWKRWWWFFRPLRAIRSRVRRHRATVTLDRQAQTFSLMGRVPNVSLISADKLQKLKERGVVKKTKELKSWMKEAPIK